MTLSWSPGDAFVPWTVKYRCGRCFQTGQTSGLIRASGRWLLVVHVSHPLHWAAFLIPVTSLGLCDFEQVDETVSSFSVVCA